MQAYPRIHRETQGSAHDERLTPADRERRDRELMIALRDGSTAALDANQIVSAVRQLREGLDPLIDGNT